MSDSGNPKHKPPGPSVTWSPSTTKPDSPVTPFAAATATSSSSSTSSGSHSAPTRTPTLTPTATNKSASLGNSTTAASPSSRHARAKSQSHPSTHSRQAILHPGLFVGPSSGRAGHVISDISGSVASPARSSTYNDPDKDAEALKIAGNEHYKFGRYTDALNHYDRAISISPKYAIYHANRAAALISLKRLSEAVTACRKSIELDPTYARPRHRLGSLFLSIGQVGNARAQFLQAKDNSKELQNLQAIETHIRRCADARRNGEWETVLTEVEAVIKSGADSSPQLFACRVEAYVKLNKLKEAESTFTSLEKLEPFEQPMIFGMVFKAYKLFVRAQLELALGEFKKATSCINSVAELATKNAEVVNLRDIVKKLLGAWKCGNSLYKSGKFNEAASAYGEGIVAQPSNSILYSSRAACWLKCSMWGNALADCDQALTIHPDYKEALLQRAFCYHKLQRWEDSVKEYKNCRTKHPDDMSVVEKLFEAQITWRRSRGLDISHMEFGGRVELVETVELFKDKISSPCFTVVEFESSTDIRCRDFKGLFKKLCDECPTLNFLRVDCLKTPEIVSEESVKIYPTFMIYKEGNIWHTLANPKPEVLEDSVKKIYNMSI